MRRLRRAVAALALAGLRAAPGCRALRTRLTWVNGIGHTEAHMREGAAFIRVRFRGTPVEWCHNPTAMRTDGDWRGYLGDLTQATTHKVGIITAEVDTLVQHLRRAVQRVGRRGVVVHIAHSQGALITALACRHLTPQEMSQIEVICFGGGACLRRTAATPFRRCMNYFAVNDPLLLVNPEALQALRSGFVDHEFCFLSPRLGDPIMDHSLLLPTYAQALEWEGARFEQLYIPIALRLWRRLWEWIVLICVAIEARIIAVLKLVIRPLVHCYGTKVAPSIEHRVRTLLAVLLIFADWILGLLNKRRGKYVPVDTVLQKTVQ